MNPQTLVLWHTKMAALQERARLLDQSGEDAIALAEEFEQFTHAHPTASDFDEMDQVARDTHDALIKTDVTKRIAAIAANTAAFQAVTAKIQAQTGANLQAAQSISLVQAQQIVASATDAVAAIKDLQAAVKAQPDMAGKVDAFCDKLEATVAALEKFRNTVNPAS